MPVGVWKVLIVDDEEGIRKVISLSLRDAGYEVLTAADGGSGLNLLRSAAPEIVIVDIRMPGMDGIEVLRRIKETDPDTEVIVATAFGEMEVAVRALQLKASDFITKPISDQALFVALERAKQNHDTRRKLREYTSLLEQKWMDTSEELARTFNFQNNLIENSIDGILGCDETGRVIIFNRSLETMLGYSKAEARGRMRFEQFLPVGAAERFRADLAAGGHGGPQRLFLYETFLLDRAGKRLPAQVSAATLFEGPTEIGLVAFFRDLRELRKLEQQFDDQARLLQQDKLISLGRLAASVVHEINNPMTGMLNYVRLMAKIAGRRALETDDLEKFGRYLELVETELSRCSRIVSNLLAFSRKSELEFSELDLNDLLRRCLLLSQHKLELQGIQVRTELAPGLPRLRGDVNQIQQAIINLIFNAVDAMPQGGLLTLTTALDSTRGWAEVRVLDTGHGIPEEDLPRIFEPFFTTKPRGQGLGLGLATVSGIIERHKGTLSVTSTPGKGSEFSFRLPLGRP